MFPLFCCVGVIGLGRGGLGVVGAYIGEGVRGGEGGKGVVACGWLRIKHYLCSMVNKIMTTEQYSKDVYISSKGKGKGTGCSQQYIRRLIAANKLDKLNNVVKVMKSGKYHLLEVTV